MILNELMIRIIAIYKQNTYQEQCIFQENNKQNLQLPLERQCFIDFRVNTNNHRKLLIFYFNIVHLKFKVQYHATLTTHFVILQVSTCQFPLGSSKSTFKMNQCRYSMLFLMYKYYLIKFTLISITNIYLNCSYVTINT